MSSARVSRALLCGLGGLALLYGIASLAWPLGWDQGIMAWVGSVVASGGLPFLDAWDPKGPAAYLPFAAAGGVAGHLSIAYRVVELVLLLGGALATASVVRALGFPRAAPFAALALVLTQPSLGFLSTLQPDQWAGWLVAGTIALTLGPSRRGWLLGLAGGLVGLAGLIKPQYGLFLVVPLAGAWNGTGARWQRLWPILGGAALPLLVCLAWFAAGNGLASFLDGYLAANLESRLDRSIPLVTFREALLQAATALPYLWPLGIAAAFGLRSIWRRNPRDGAILLAWLVLLAGGLAVQGRWFTYVWTPGLPLLVVLATIGLAHLLAPPPSLQPPLARHAGMVLGVGLGLAALILACRPLVREARGAAALAVGRVDRLDYLRRYWGGGPNFSAVQVARAAEHVARVTSPDETVLVWPEPGVNVLAGRHTPSRFATVAALTRYQHTARRRRYQAEFLATLEVRPPSLVLIDSMATGNSPAYLGHLPTRFPEFLRLLHRDYDPAGTVGKYHIWVPRHLAARRSP